MKWTRLVSVVVLTAISVCRVAAHDLIDLDIHVMINDLGNARVIETRTYTIGHSGSEGYIKQYDLGAMEVGEFAVTDETGQPYREVTPWDVDASRAAKAGCCGIHLTDDGPELCWGIGNAGQHTYELRYTLTRLVKSFDDYDGFNFKFFDSNSPHPQHVKVTITREQGDFVAGATRVWAFGFMGNIKVIDGAIVAETTTPLSHDHESVTVMTRLDKGLFHPVTTVEGTFRDELLVEAFKGSDYTLEDYDADAASAETASEGGAGYEPDNNPSLTARLSDTLGDIAGSLLWAVAPFLFILSILMRHSDYNKDKHLKRLFGVPRVAPRQWVREIPLDGNLNRVRAVLDTIDGDKGLRERQMSAYILRLIDSGRLRVLRQVNDQGESERVIGVSNPGPPPLDNGPYSANLIGHLLLQFMWQAAGEDHVLRPSELENYAKQSPVEHRQFVKLLNRSLDHLPYKNIHSVTPQQANSVYGLKKFLEEFTLVDERHIEEVGLWREYLVFATLFGISDRVAKELRAVWPEELSSSLDDMLDTMYTGNLLSASMHRAVDYVEKYETPTERAARIAQERRSRSSGGGGGSSYGGGGGSSGGGGSGIR